MAEERYPVTQAIRFLRDHNVSFTPHLYEYMEHGGTEVAAAALGFDEHAVVKTIVLENKRKQPIIVLMHGDRQVSTKNLARLLGWKSANPCDPKVVTKHTGFIVGGTSPFGTKSPIPVVMQETILPLETVYINGGKRGFLVGVNPAEARELLNARLADIAA